MRVAFFGGSFDPPHNGHIAIAKAAKRSLALDRILFAPVGLQPLKPDGASAAFEDRVAMTRLAIAGNPGFEVSTADAPRSANRANYTVDTLTGLREAEAVGSELFLLLGADAFRKFPYWYRAAEIPFLATLVIASRPSENLTTLTDFLPAALTYAPVPAKPGGTVDDLLEFTLTDTATGAKAGLYLLPNLNYNISATDLRQQIQLTPAADSAGDLPPLLPQKVLDYIHQHKLYQ